MKREILINGSQRETRVAILEDDRLVSEDGVLAGSTLTMVAAIANAIEQGRIDLSSAAKMASGSPAHFLGLGDQIGAIRPGFRADLVTLRDDFTIGRTWIGGVPG